MSTKIKIKPKYNLLKGLTQKAITELRRAYQRKTKAGIPKTPAEKQAWAYYYAVRRQAIKTGKVKGRRVPQKHDLDWYITHGRVKGLPIGDSVCYYHTRRNGELQSRTKKDNAMFEEWRILKIEWREYWREKGLDRTKIDEWYEPQKAERLKELEEEMRHRKDLIACRKVKPIREVEKYEYYH